MGTTEAIMEQAGRDRVARDATRELLAERVARGVALLDREMPDWWRTDRTDTEPWDGVTREPIDLNRLSMGDGGWCVFGQLENPGMGNAYATMARRIFGPESVICEGVDHGVYDYHDRHYPMLAELWREVIKRRRANA